jgi:hypothetical protein
MRIDCLAAAAMVMACVYYVHKTHIICSSSFASLSSPGAQPPLPTAPIIYHSDCQTHMIKAERITYLNYRSHGATTL